MIRIDPERCIGSGVCTVYAPRTFEIDDAGVSVVVDPAGEPLEQIRAAAAGCPARAIDVVDDPDGTTGRTS